MGSRARDQPQDFSVGDRRAQGRGAPRNLIGPLAALQAESLSDLVLATISVCVSEMAVAAECLTFDSGKLLSIISGKLEHATSDAQARAIIALCENLTDTLCNSNLRYAVFADAPFPATLVEMAQEQAASSQGLREFFDALAKSPHAARLHGGMLIPARGSTPAITLRDLANRTEGGSIPVLGEGSSASSATNIATPTHCATFVCS